MPLVHFDTLLKNGDVLHQHGSCPEGGIGAGGVVCDKKPILIVLHQARSTPGRVGQLLCQAGFPLDIRCPALGDILPSTLDDHDGVVIFGGPMSANGDENFIKYETEWLKVPLRENVPFLGICLGAQMLARHIGGRVASDPDGEIEVGWYPIEATKAGQALFDWPHMVYHFHIEGVYDLPQETHLLAQGCTYPNQAFRYGENAWGIQFHAELTQAMMHRWVVRAAHRFEDRGGQKGQAHLEGRLLYDKPLRHWLEQALNRIFDTPAQECT